MQPRSAVLLFSCAGLLGSSTSALAAEPAGDATPVVERTTATVDAGPNRLLLATGAASFAFSYGGASWVGATSPRTADRALFVPFAGPWITLAVHGMCGERGAGCSQETTYAALMVADGLVQAAGAVQIALAFLHHELRQIDEPVVRSSRAARIAVAPSSAGGRGVALAAVGMF